MMNQTKVQDFWAGSYGREPFDLKLLLLRFLRCLPVIVLLVLAGTVLFGGGYYLKNVVFGPDPDYEVTVTFKMEYTNPPVLSGDYVINQMTWNTYADSDAFLECCVGDQGGEDWLSAENLREWTSMLLNSDVHVPSMVVRTPRKEWTEEVVRRVKAGMPEFIKGIPEVASIRPIDSTAVREVWPDVRPLRALVLSALLSCFFVVTGFGLIELAGSSIYLPATLRSRYGLAAAGTVNAKELTENLRRLLGEQGTVAVCQIGGGKSGGGRSASKSPEAEEPAASLQRVCGESLPGLSWIAVSDPVGDRSATDALRGADKVLLAVPAGLHAGKPLEYVLEYLREQEISVTAAFLWEADETLIRRYYRLSAQECGGKR